jgi:L-lactate dehydrogenase
MQCNDWSAKRSKIVEDMKNSAYHIIDYKGATFFAVGLALVRIIEAIIRNQKSVLTVSTLLEGEYGIKDVCLSVPSIVSRQGVERIIEGHLSQEELLSLSKSASVLKEAIAELYTKKEQNNNYL